MLMVEQTMSIKILHEQGLSQRAIARQLGISRNTVKRYLKNKIVEPVYKDRKPGRPTKLASFKTYIDSRLNSAYPEKLPATVLFQEITTQGYIGSLSLLRAYIRDSTPAKQILPIQRFETEPGKQLQVDWAEFRRGKHRLSAFIATLGYSRYSYVEFVTDEKITTLLQCLANAFDYFGGVCKEILFDNMKTVVIARHAYGEGHHRFHQKLWDFAKHYGFIPKLCQPYRAQTKGKVERFIGYLRYSFFVPLKTLLASVNLPVDKDTANKEVLHWLAQTANVRLHQGLKEQPFVRWQYEKTALQAIPMPYGGLAKPIVKTRAVLQPVLTELAHYPTTTLQHQLEVYEQLLH